MTLASPRPEQYDELLLLADGEFTRTYVAQDRRLHTRVVLKTIHPDRIAEPRAHTWLRNEHRILHDLAAAGSRAGRRLLDHLEADGALWLVLAWAPGETLARWLGDHCPLSPTLWLHLADGLADVLDDIHGAGVVHGDVAPDNIVVADQADKSHLTVCLIDFASASPIGGQRAAPGHVLCKAQYAAPEVLLGQAPMLASDLYSLGVVLYEALAGQPPYQAHTPTDVLTLDRSRIDWNGVESALPTMKVLLESLLDPNSEGRPGSAKDLRRFIAEEISRRSEETVRPRSGILQTSFRRIVRASWRKRSEPDSHAEPLETAPFAASRAVGAQRYSPPVDASVAAPPARATPLPPSAAAPTQHPQYLEISHEYRVPMPPREKSPGKTANRSFVTADFSVFAPASVTSGRSFVLELWISKPEDRDRLFELASRPGRRVERLGDRGHRESPSGMLEPPDLEMSFLLRLDDFDIEDRCDTISWLGDVTNVPFLVRTPDGLSPGSYPGQVKVMHCGFLVTRIVFDVIVGADLSSSMNRPARTEPVRTAFASYAREDWPEVVRRVHGIQAAGIDVFLDVLTLRAGDAWEEQVFASILARDIFFLFWSPAAMHSPWVEREWRFALAQRGIEFIHPVPLASPELAPPPEELASRHFNDLILLCLASQQVALANPTHLEPDSM